MGTDESLKCIAICPSTPLILNNIKFDIDFYLLLIRGAETVLGSMAETIGSVITDYYNLTMESSWKNTLVKLQGEHKGIPQ